MDKIQCKIDIMIIVRDWEGIFLATMRINRPLFLDSLLTEAVGAYQAILFGLDLGLSQIILEGDSLQVIQHITKAKES